MVFTSGVLNRIGNKINQQFFTEAIANTIQSDTSQCGNYENCLSHFLTTSKQRFYTKVVSKYFFGHFSTLCTCTLGNKKPENRQIDGKVSQYIHHTVWTLRKYIYSHSRLFRKNFVNPTFLPDKLQEVISVCHSVEK